MSCRRTYGPVCSCASIPRPPAGTRVAGGRVCTWSTRRAMRSQRPHTAPARAPRLVGAAIRSHTAASLLPHAPAGDRRPRRAGADDTRTLGMVVGMDQASAARRGQAQLSGLRRVSGPASHARVGCQPRRRAVGASAAQRLSRARIQPHHPDRAKENLHVDDAFMQITNEIAPARRARTPRPTAAPARAGARRRLPDRERCADACQPPSNPRRVCARRRPLPFAVALPRRGSIDTTHSTQKHRPLRPNGGNWKCHATRLPSRSRVRELNAGEITADVEVICAPGMVYLPKVQSTLDRKYQLAAQNCWVQIRGRCSRGEVAAEILVDLRAADASRPPPAGRCAASPTSSWARRPSTPSTRAFP